MLGLRAGALWGAGRALGMRATEARFFTRRRTAGTTRGFGAAFLTFALAFTADFALGFRALAAFFLAPLPGFLPLPLAMPSSLRFEVVSFLPDHAAAGATASIHSVMQVFSRLPLDASALRRTGQARRDARRL